MYTFFSLIYIPSEKNADPLRGYILLLYDKADVLPNCNLREYIQGLYFSDY